MRNERKKNRAKTLKALVTLDAVEEEKGDLEQSRWIAVMLDPLDEWEKLVVTV